ncbi:hypothetical protein [Macrococcus equipercicus]|uniref:Uncharacterized protein n=1 Tax=Macrococcus equipercicus TaxID=69967 RepID=A0A9Q9BQ97_9STAP|nr:hypothetical protein [Macrococcus equipercicus]UTH13489.1 hypothetical protein KFV11_09690 [Macrococcus equipercicus]
MAEQPVVDKPEAKQLLVGNSLTDKVTDEVMVKKLNKIILLLLKRANALFFILNKQC